jgi:hypothetical protein
MYAIGSITTHSTGARVSLPFIENLRVSAIRRARLIRALDAFWCFYGSNVWSKMTA